MKIIIDGKVVDTAETPVFLVLECGDFALLNNGLHGTKRADSPFIGIVPATMNREEAIKQFNKAGIHCGHHLDCNRGKTRIEII